MFKMLLLELIASRALLNRLVCLACLKPAMAQVQEERRNNEAGEPSAAPVAQPAGHINFWEDQERASANKAAEVLYHFAARVTFARAARLCLPRVALAVR